LVEASPNAEPVLRGTRQSKRERIAALTRGRLLVAWCVALYSLPALYDLLSDPQRSPFRWLAADTYYYLTVSRNIARHGVIGFDGQHASNGFHPLWQAWGALLELLREHLGLGAVGPLLLLLSGVVATASAVWLLGLTLLRARRESLLILGLPVGIHALLVIPAWLVGLRAIYAHGLRDWGLPVMGSLWSFTNGMESEFVILSFAAALFLGTTAETVRSPRRAALFGVALAALTLSRFDHGLIAAALLAGLATRAARENGKQLAIAGLAFAAPVAAYLLFSRWHFGTAIPLSGAAKSTFPHPTPDNWNLIRGLLRGSPSMAPAASDSHWWLPVASRQLQTVLPAALCTVYLLFRTWRRSATELQALLASAAVGAIALAAYNFCFTKGEDQGYWYYPVSTLLPSLFVLAEQLPRPWPRPELRAATAVALTALMVAFFVHWHRRAAYNDAFRTLAQHTSTEARNFYQGRPPKLLEIDDGAVGYNLDTRAMSCFLALDPAGFEALRRGKLLELALARGYDRVASSFYRPNRTDPEGLAGWIGTTLRQDVSGFRFEKELATSDGQLLIVRVYRR